MRIAATQTRSLGDSGVELVSRLTRASAFLGLAAALTTIGWALAAGYASFLFAAAALIALGLLAANQRGAFIGVLLLAGMNGLPFLDASAVVSGKLTVEDVAVVGLTITAAVWVWFDRPGGPPPNRAARRTIQAAAALLLWWSLTLIRSVVAQHVSVLRAAAFGRDFLFLALLLSLLPRVRLSRRDINVMLGVLFAGVCLFAVGQVATATGIGQPGSLIHFERTLQQSGLTRLYAHMTDLLTAGLAVALAASLLAKQRMARLLAAPAVGLLTISMIVQLTRARWIGIVVGLLAVSMWLAFHGERSVSATLRRRLGLAVAVMAVLAPVVTLAAPGVLSGGAVIHRLLSVLTDVQSGGGTVAIREQVTKAMTSMLGGQWPYGMGFVPPSSHFFSGLPNGSIRDSDLGVLNAVMTMGAIGAALVYMPLLIGLVECLRRFFAGGADRYSWLRYGGAVWIVCTLTSSVTLITLFSTSGVVLVAVFLSVLSQREIRGEPSPGWAKLDSQAQPLHGFATTSSAAVGAARSY